jgi:hypothetical protein
MLSNFNDVKEPTLRAYNRLQAYRNITEMDGVESAKDYLAQFSGACLANIVLVNNAITKFGRDTVVQAITRTVEPELTNGASG